MSEPYSPAAHLVGERLRTTRLALGLSQEDVADLARMHVTNYGKIERGLANPSLVTILRLACVLGLDVGTVTAGLDLEHLPADLSVQTAAEYLRARHRQQAESHSERAS